LKANINYETQNFSTPKFEINYLDNIPVKQKSVNLNCYEKVKTLLRADHMNKEEEEKIRKLCNQYRDCFYDEDKGLTSTNAVTHN